MTFTISRNNNFYTYEDTSDNVLVIHSSTLTLTGVFMTDFFYFENVLCDWHDCTSPSASSALDLMQQVRDMTG